jgi:segregation and condensation protein B
MTSLQVPDIDHLTEALLFVADGPVQLDDLAKAVGCDRAALEQSLERLAGFYLSRGLRVMRTGSHAQMVTAPEAGPVVEHFLGLGISTRLSAPALECLAIIAYRQPITRAQIEAIRGVNSDAVIRTLLARALIAPIGRLEQVGRPVLYGTTFEFLQYFGIQSLDELPLLPDLPNYSEGPSGPSGGGV